MPSTSKPYTATSAAFALTAVTLLATTVTSAHAHERSLLSHKGVRPRGTMNYVGCFSSSDGLTDQGSYTYQTTGWCQPICTKANQAVMGLSGGSDCWCGDTFPEQSSKVDDSNCDTPCNGFGSVNCGGTNYWSVYTSGTEDQSAISYASGDDSSSSSSAAPSSSSTTAAASSSTPPASTSAAAAATTPATSASAFVITSIAPGHTVIITQPAAQATGSGTSPTPTADSKGGSTNVAGIAAGVVVGVVAAAAIIGGLIFFLKRRRQQAVTDDYKRSTQVGDFMRRGRNGGSEPKPPPTAYSNMSDSRLDPTLQRRNSAGSIADDQDYSRRILRVANPDNS